MPLLVIDNELTTIEAKGNILKKTHPTLLYISPMIEQWMGRTDLCQDMFLPLTGSSLKPRNSTLPHQDLSTRKVLPRHGDSAFLQVSFIQSHASRWRQFWGAYHRGLMRRTLSFRLFSGVALTQDSPRRGLSRGPFRTIQQCRPASLTARGI